MKEKVSKTQNPSAYTDNDVPQTLHDKLGRQVVRYTMREVVVTASASLTNGTKTELVAGSAGNHLDLKQITCANDSDTAVTITIQDESTTVRTLVISASGSETFVFDPALLQSSTGVSWYADMPDITGTTVSLSAEFIKES